MFLKFLRNTLIIVLCIVFLTVPTSAGWLDNWFDQATSTAPNYFEGQKRGYFTAGSFSARIPTSNDYLFSIERPRVKFGCGGIDMFLGGISFTNFQYLVNKFQRLIQAAPIVAFQIALNTLSPTLNQILGNVNEIIDALNQLQFNECQILKPFTTLNLRDDNAGAKFEAAAKTALDSLGATTLYYSLFEGSKAAGSQDKVKPISGNTVSADRTIDGCPAEVQQLVQNSNLTIYQYVVNQNPNLSFFVPYLRAMVGDLKAVKGASVYTFSYDPPCSQAKTELIRNGTLYIKTCSDNTSCCIQESNTKLNDKVANILLSAMTKIESKQAISSGSDYIKIAQMSPLPVHMLMRYSMVTKDPSLLVVVSDTVAKGSFYNATLDMIKELDKAIAYLEKVASIGGANTSQDKPCSIDFEVKNKIAMLRENLKEFASELKTAYIASVSETNQIAQYSYLYSQFENKAFKILSDKFGSGTAMRAF